MMNEQSKQLAEQAGAYVSTRTLTSNPPQQVEMIELWDDRIKKFAELIIKETLQVARAGIEFGPSMDEAVENYFGVKL